ncbi:hypothetical protein S40293_00483 [Stachybotrys chartarum IBT 40293]|nr:hypothetical protein S40293_00483 [Stachybotrys chartarum IBT 40293]
MAGLSAGDGRSFDSGEYVPSDEEFEIEYMAEPQDRYHEHRLYPLLIGEVLNNTYRVEHKLGHGGFSTVWMAQDMRDKTYVALKIVESGSAGDCGLAIQEELVRSVPDTSELLVCKDTYTLSTPHGVHRVLVFPLQGPNLRDRPAFTIGLSSRMSAALQVPQALKSLRDGGIVHRYINSANIMFGIEPLENYSSADDRLILGDFGVPIKAGTSVTQKVQSPSYYYALERLHGHDPTFATEM